ncbi:MAG: hypothetical protein JNL84_00470 [Candidatus Accumulibacter sp.]|nr:hypothetical protein [Accumulibacter sp.]
MYIVDDPTLALITRFIGTIPAEADGTDNEFFCRQIATIQAYVNQFPPEEHEQRAIHWIESNARNYRRQWQKQAAITTLSHSRCADCPLTSRTEHRSCTIHSRWLALLQRYATDEISSNDYVAHSLALLNAHKSWLKVSRRHVSPRASMPEAPANQPVNFPTDAHSP